MLTKHEHYRNIQIIKMIVTTCLVPHYRFEIEMFPIKFNRYALQTLVSLIRGYFLPQRDSTVSQTERIMVKCAAGRCFGVCKRVNGINSLKNRKKKCCPLTLKLKENQC